MPFAYFADLSEPEQLVYLLSERVPAIRIRGVKGLRPLALALEAALRTGQTQAVQMAGTCLLAALTQTLRTRGVALEVLQSRPRREIDELHGLYLREDGKVPHIQVWMRTARKHQVVAYRTFLRTLVHELCHHLDFELIKLPWSFHTLGFYQRESSLLNQLVPGPARRKRPAGGRGAGA